MPALTFKPSIKYASLDVVRRHKLKRLLWQAQGGVCAICEKLIPEALISYRDITVLDHNHKTGMVRGLLCVPCNITLGHYEKSKRLRPLLDAYLAEPPVALIERFEFRYTPRSSANKEGPIEGISLPDMDTAFVVGFVKDL